MFFGITLQKYELIFKKQGNKYLKCRVLKGEFKV